jgi:hypothetical protein
MRLPLTIAAALLATACSTSGDPAAADAAGGIVRDGVRYTASTAVLESFPVQLHTTVEVHNIGNATARLEFPSGCVVLLQAFRQPGDSEPVWDQARAVMCTMALQIVDLAPGERRTYSTRTDAGEILGDSLPDGTYHFRARVAVNGSALEIPAGSAELAIQR